MTGADVVISRNGHITERYHTLFLETLEIKNSFCLRFTEE